MDKAVARQSHGRLSRLLVMQEQRRQREYWTHGPWLSPEEAVRLLQLAAAYVRRRQGGGERRIPLPSPSGAESMALLQLALESLQHEAASGRGDRLLAQAVEQAADQPRETLARIHHQLQHRRTFSPVSLHYQDDERLTPVHRVDAAERITDAFVDQYLWREASRRQLFPVWMQPADDALPPVQVHRLCERIAAQAPVWWPKAVPEEVSAPAGQHACTAMVQVHLTQLAERVELVFLNRLLRLIVDEALADYLTAKCNVMMSFKDMQHTNSVGVPLGLAFAGFLLQWYAVAAVDLPLLASWTGTHAHRRAPVGAFTGRRVSSAGAGAVVARGCGRRGAGTPAGRRLLSHETVLAARPAHATGHLRLPPGAQSVRAGAGGGAVGGGVVVAAGHRAGRLSRVGGVGRAESVLALGAARLGGPPPAGGGAGAGGRRGGARLAAARAATADVHGAGAVRARRRPLERFGAGASVALSRGAVADAGDAAGAATGGGARAEPHQARAQLQNAGALPAGDIPRAGLVGRAGHALGARAGRVGTRLAVDTAEAATQRPGRRCGCPDRAVRVAVAGSAAPGHAARPRAHASGAGSRVAAAAAVAHAPHRPPRLHGLPGAAGSDGHFHARQAAHAEDQPVAGVSGALVAAHSRVAGVGRVSSAGPRAGRVRPRFPTAVAGGEGGAVEVEGGGEARPLEAWLEPSATGTSLSSRPDRASERRRPSSSASHPAAVNPVRTYWIDIQLRWGDVDDHDIAAYAAAKHREYTAPGARSLYPSPTGMLVAVDLAYRTWAGYGHGCAKVPQRLHATMTRVMQRNTALLILQDRVRKALQLYSVDTEEEATEEVAGGGTAPTAMVELPELVRGRRPPVRQGGALAGVGRAVAAHAVGAVEGGRRVVGAVAVAAGHGAATGGGRAARTAAGPGAHAVGRQRQRFAGGAGVRRGPGVAVGVAD
eukprot:ctg_1928.g546